ncbi:hypothetical protein AGOR_G00143180 [Albula goreensis]|uniref:NXPE C-terminal domain-containing protein n=1 Tax=Albula goreensis TaxID=1534307 RepID=A0A8T3D538_9TELE|nr:hypothetical protein AGOR_G00143180 [Albula goreensis]
MSIGCREVVVQLFKEETLFIFICLGVALLMFYVCKLNTWTHMEIITKRSFRKMTVDDVMSSIWGELPISARFTSLQNSSSAVHSTARLENPRDQYCVGDTLNVLVEMRDYEGCPKKQGGDFILARIHTPNLQASSSGYVTDLLNGSYRVSFTLFWPGAVRVSLRLIHPSEGVHLLGKISSHNYGKINYTGTFINGSKREESQCGIRLDTDKALCEYRKKEDGEYYACIKPQTLPCSSLQTMSSTNIQPQITVNETELLAQKNTGTQIKMNFTAVKVIGCFVGAHRQTEKCEAGMKSPFPSGYFFTNRWSSPICNFISECDIDRCLKGKRLLLFGDSTVRQWIEYLEKKVSDLKFVPPVDEYSLMLAVDNVRNITVQWKMHAYPFVTAHNVLVNKCMPISRELDRVPAGEGRSDVVVVIGVGQHFRPFPLEIFIQRLINIRQAILRLQARSPRALVVIKLENTRELSSTMTHLSDWLGHIQNLAQRKVFGDLRVALVDAWEMSIAADTFATHPNNIVVASEIAVALSHICHYGGLKL